MSNTTFIVDVYGGYSVEQLRIVWHDCRRPPHAELDQMIAETWRRVERECHRTGAVLFNGKMYRLLNYHADRERFKMEVGPTDFAEFLGTNFHNYHRVEEFGWEMYSNAVGISAVVIAADGNLLLGRRSEKVACMPRCVHTFGGALEADDHQNNGTVDGFAAIRRELQEELGLKWGDFRQLVCLGMIRDATFRQPELIFRADVSLSSEQLGRQLHHDEHNEHLQAVTCPDDADSLMAFLDSDEPISAIGLGSICLYGRSRFGEEWYRAALAKIA